MDIISFLTASTLLTLMPGPDIVYVLVQGLTFGRKSGIAVGAGLASGLLVHTTAAALGLSLLIASSPTAFNTIKYIGIAYLVYMGVKSFVARNKTTQSQQAVAEPTGKLYLKGVMMNLVNPKIILFFLAFLPQFVNTDSANATTDIFTLGGLFSLQAAVVFSAVAILAGAIPIGEMKHKTVSTINASIYLLIAIYFVIS